MQMLRIRPAPCGPILIKKKNLFLGIIFKPHQSYLEYFLKSCVLEIGHFSLEIVKSSDHRKLEMLFLRCEW